MDVFYPGAPAPAANAYTRRRDWEADAIKCATHYMVNMWIGPGRWSRAQAASLDDVRTVVKRIGKDEYGRRPLVYAVLNNGSTVFMDEGLWR